LDLLSTEERITMAIVKKNLPALPPPPEPLSFTVELTPQEARALCSLLRGGVGNTTLATLGLEPLCHALMVEAGSAQFNSSAVWNTFATLDSGVRLKGSQGK
jgi:hypothetical protein